jgi:hypothetical protein
LWLIVKGFNSRATVPERDKTEIDEIGEMSLSKA